MANSIPVRRKTEEVMASFRYQQVLPAEGLARLRAETPSQLVEEVSAKLREEERKPDEQGQEGSLMSLMLGQRKEL